MTTGRFRSLGSNGELPAGRLARVANAPGHSFESGRDHSLGQIVRDDIANSDVKWPIRLMPHWNPPLIGSAPAARAASDAL